MATNPLEIPKTTFKFDSLALLREELVKQTTNPDRLGEFQKTIDEALEKGEREGVIEFTEDEWKSLITNEDLPPIEQVKKLLKNKIEGMKEVKTESKEKREGIMGELDKKVDKVKKSVEDAKEKATGSIKEALSPIEKIKAGFEKAQKSLGEMWSNLWTPVKFAWYTLWATLGFKFGKDALAAMTKEKAEAVVEDVKKKAGEVGKVGEETPKEGKEGVIEKAAPIAILGGAGLGILNFIKKKNILPESIVNKLGDPTDKTGFLKKLAGNRALRLFGISGITLLGIGKLSETLQDPKIAAELGEMPESPEEAKKEWWKKAIEKAGIGIKDGAEEIWSLVNGEKLDDYLTSREDREAMEKRGYVTLEEHPSIKGAKKELGIFEKQCEVFFNENRAAFDAAVVAGLIFKPGMILGAGAKGASVAMGILKMAHPGTLIPAGIVLALLGNAFEGMKHIQVPKDIGPEDLKDMLEIPDIKEFLESRIPGITEQIHFDTVAKEFQTLEQKIKEFNTKSFWEKLAKGAADKIIESPQEKINSANQVGFKTLVSSLELLERQNETPGAYKKLLGDEKEPGFLKNLITKLGAGNALTEGDIRALMESTEGTNIRIFPRDNTKSGTTIQWQTVDEHGTIKGDPRNICVNPTLEYSAQFEAARDFVVDEYDLNTMNVVGKVGGGFREIASELAESIKNNNEKSGSLIETIVRDGASIVTIGLETFAVDYLGNKYLLGPWNLVQSAFLNIKNPEDRLEMQEGLVEYGQGLAPVILITAIKNKYSGHGFLGFKNRGFLNGLLKNSIVESITYPLHILKGVGKGSIIGGKYIYERAFAGNYKEILSDPKNQIKAQFYETKHRAKSLQKFIPVEKLRDIGGKHARIAKLEEARGLLYKAKQSWLRGGNIKEALNILGHSSKKFEHEIVDDQTNKKIKELIDNVEKELEEQRKALSYLEDGVRQKFPQEDFFNRPAEIESKKAQINMETPEGKKAAQEAFDESQKEIKNMEEKRLQVEKEAQDAKKTLEANPNDTHLKQDFDAKQKAYIEMTNTYHEKHRDLSEIREAMGELLHGRKPKIRIGESHIKSVKGLRGSAKILGVLALTVGAGVAIEKVAGAIHGDSHEEKESPESSSEDDEKYFGFRKDANGEVKTNKEKNEFSCETPEEFNRRIEVIETQYTEAINKFFDPEFIKNLSSDEREKKIQEAADGHMLRVDMMKSLIKENKTMMEAFWNKKFTNEETGEEIVPEDIRKQGVKAFMFIHKKDGKLTLNYMNHQDMKNVFYILYDASREGFFEPLLGEKGDMAADLTLRVAPFTGSFMDGKDAYTSFSRGNIGDGIMSTAWCLGGLIVDVATTAATFTGVGATVGVPVQGLAMSARGAKIASVAGKALLHNGIQLGAQFGMSLAKVPRSESVSIESL